MKTTLEVLDYLPLYLKSCVLNSKLDLHNISEIRLRENQNIAVTIKDKNYILNEDIDFRLLNQVYEKVINYSLHSHQDEINKGFVTLKNGCRVGVCGTSCANGANVSKVTSLNFRIAKQYIGCSEVIEDVFKSTIVVGPPSSGKTTFLRDIARRLSYDKRVCIVDERYEITGYKDSFDLGPMCDCLRGYKKKDGIEISLRTLSPQVIVFDEVCGEFEEIVNCFNAGAKVVTSVHAFTQEEFLKRQVCKKLVKTNCFEQIVFLSATPGKVEKIILL